MYPKRSEAGPQRCFPSTVHMPLLRFACTFSREPPASAFCQKPARQRLAAKQGRSQRLSHPHCARYTAIGEVDWLVRIDSMATAEALDLHVLYEQDETAWLEAMSTLAAC